jgi:hypothetical protein
MDGRPDPLTALRDDQEEVALRYADDAERNLKRLRKALRRRDLGRSAERLAALQSDASRIATVLAFAAVEHDRRRDETD